jgi:hypothetical protein
MATQDSHDTTDPKSKATKATKATKREASGNMSDMTLQVPLQAHLGKSLEAVYQSVVEESVPERLRNLLEELERRETMSSSS